jgi:hypothetical protein
LFSSYFSSRASRPSTPVPRGRASSDLEEEEEEEEEES